MSERCSGDIELFSDSSVLAVELASFELVAVDSDWSKMSVRVCVGNDVELFLVLRGLAIGRVFRAGCGPFLVGFLERMVLLVGAE